MIRALNKRANQIRILQTVQKAVHRMFLYYVYRAASQGTELLDQANCR